MPPHNHLGTRGPSTPPSTLPTSSKARAIKERAHLRSPGRGLETFSGVTPREAPEHLRHGEELSDQGSNLYLLSFALTRTADLSIGGASSDTLPVPSDECSLVTGIRTYSPVPDARRARSPRRGDSSSAELFGYIKTVAQKFHIGSVSRGQCHIYQNPTRIRLSLFKESTNDTSFLIWTTRSPRITEDLTENRGEYLARDTCYRRISARICSSQSPNPSINTSPTSSAPRPSSVLAPPRVALLRECISPTSSAPKLSSALAPPRVATHLSTKSPTSSAPKPSSALAPPRVALLPLPGRPRAGRPLEGRPQLFQEDLEQEDLGQEDLWQEDLLTRDDHAAKLEESPEDLCSDRKCLPRTVSYLPESNPDTSFLI
ncbi:hypothetical protein F511_28492 [Dorcoceras hygrometricum]|uniref:Uncharacterized protein n=1 Tax=Dorcoceras hygrometricum TaxID=472368 RepID=A0A2Z7C088_9LAMI|nr:hypothetical protein F511_28492 [Dorcoceras hygrometricum]